MHWPCQPRHSFGSPQYSRLLLLPSCPARVLMAPRKRRLVPSKPLRPCAVRGCPNAAISYGRCAQHAKERMLQIDAQRPTSSQRGYGRSWRELRRSFLAEHPVCAHCGAPATDVDHIVARARGGSDEWFNLRALCHRCHSAKTAKHDSYRGIGGQNR